MSTRACKLKLVAMNCFLRKNSCEKELNVARSRARQVNRTFPSSTVVRWRVIRSRISTGSWTSDDLAPELVPFAGGSDSDTSKASSTFRVGMMVAMAGVRVSVRLKGSSCDSDESVSLKAIQRLHAAIEMEKQAGFEGK